MLYTGIDVLHVWRRLHQTFRHIQDSTGRVQGMTSCDPDSPCVQLVARTIFGQRGPKVPCHFPFRERKFHIIFTLRSESSRERTFHGTNVPGSESSRERKFHLWKFRSWERKYVGTKGNWNFCPLELSLPRAKIT